jgi:hypothetical protein
MTASQAWIGYAGTAALTVVLAGVVARRRYRAWCFFALFLAVTLISTLMIAVWPNRFYTRDFWQAKETALSLLRFGMALELAYRTFRSFPGALATVRWVLLFVIVATFAAVVAVSGGGTDYRSFMTELHPRVLNGTIWLFTSIAVLILWYRLPVAAFYKSVLLSYVPFLLIFTVTMNALGSVTADRLAWLSYLYQLAYIALMIHWAHAAWRKVEAPARPAGVQASLGATASA